MLNLVVTGGIATGKTTFCREFQRYFPQTRVFDCDKEVHRLLTSAQVVSKLRNEFGDGVIAPGGQVDRKALRDIVFAKKSKRRTLEGILHPEVRRACLKAQEEARGAKICQVFLADVPLYYESEFRVKSDFEVAVALSPALQLKRLINRSTGMGEEMARTMIQSQMPIQEKAEMADIVIWNGGSLRSLTNQIQLFNTWLKKN